MPPSDAENIPAEVRPEGSGKSGRNTLLSLIIAWLLALTAIAAALAGKWLNFPISKQLTGGHFSLGPYAPAAATRFVPWSFGCAAVLLIFLGAVAFHARRWRGLAWVGALLLWLAFFGAFKVALTDARLLQTLVLEFSQQQAAGQYSLQSLPVNLGGEPSVWTQLDANSIEDRLVASWYFVHLGWWAALSAGLLALCYGAGRVRSVRIPVLAAAGVVLMGLGCALGPALAEWTLMRSHRLEAAGDYSGAVRTLRQALALDGWQALNLANYAAIGGLDALRGSRQTPEYHVYHAELPSTQVDPLAALAELHEALPQAGHPLAEVIRQAEGALYTQYASSLHSAGAYGAAAAASQHALERDPDSLLPAYYLSRDSYLVGHYADAAAFSARTVARVDDPSIRANLLSNAGDAYTQLGDYVRANLAYRESYRYDYLLNLRALSALNGPGIDLQ